MKAKTLVVLLAVCFVGFSIAQSGKQQLSKSGNLNLTSSYIQNKFLVAGSPLFGVSSADSSKGQAVSEIIDLNFNDVYVIDDSQAGFGLKCTADIKCVKGQPVACPAYNNAQPQCFGSTVPMRFYEDKVDPGMLPINFKLITSTPDWVAKNGPNGVWGLSPSSVFWNYLANAYDFQSVEVSYKLAMDNYDNQYKLDKVNLDSAKSQLTINGRSSDNPIIYSNLNSSYSSWVIDNARISLFSGDDQAGVSICVDTSVNAYFLADYDSWNQTRYKLLGQLCDYEYDCEKKNSSFTNVDNMRITFLDAQKKKLSIDLGAVDFIEYDENDKAQFGVQLLGNSSLCSSIPGIKYAVGRLFFTKAEMTLKYTPSSTPQFQIGFAEIPRDSSFFLPMLMIIVGIVTIVVVALIAWINFPRQQKEAEQEEGEYKDYKDDSVKQRETDKQSP